MKIANRFSEAEKASIIDAIVEAERNTSGEIRVHIERHCKKSPLDRAVTVFADLKMHKTQLRNGVLLYLAIDDHKLAIIGDVGINKLVPPDFWEGVKTKMIEKLSKEEYILALTEGIKAVGEHLKTFFPYKAELADELSNEISFSD